MPLFTIVYGNKKGLRQKMYFDFFKIIHTDFRIREKTLKFINNKLFKNNMLEVLFKPQI